MFFFAEEYYMVISLIRFVAMLIAHIKYVLALQYHVPLLIVLVSALLTVAGKIYCYYLRYSLFQKKIICTHTINKFKDL